jgi:hypothetical protein
VLARLRSKGVIAEVVKAEVDETELKFRIWFSEANSYIGNVMLVNT